MLHDLAYGKDLLLAVKAGFHMSMDDIRSLFLEHHVNTCHQLATNCAQSRAVMFAFCAFALIKSLQFGFIADRHTGRLPQSVA